MTDPVDVPARRGSRVLPAQPAPLRVEARSGLVTALVVALLGLPVGLVWAAIAPRVDVVTATGRLDFVDAQTKDFIAADGLLFALGVAAGLLTGLVVWRRGHGRPLGALLGIACGGVLATLLAARTGAFLDARTEDAVALAAGALAPGSPAELPLRLNSYAVLLGWPAMAVLVFTVRALRRPHQLPS